jgi:hypothetical protein
MSLGWAAGRASVPLAFLALLFGSTLAFAAPPQLDDIRDIRGPIAIPPWWHWPLAIAVAVILATAVTFAVRGWRARRLRPLTPLQLARQALAAAEAHAREGRSREWAGIVADTVRGALAARLGAEVLPQTTAELSEAPWARPPLSDGLEIPRVLSLLETCDLARFARARLDTAGLLASTGSASEIVDRLYAPPPRRTAAIAAHPQPVTP